MVNCVSLVAWSRTFYLLQTYLGFEFFILNFQSSDWKKQNQKHYPKQWEQKKKKSFGAEKILPTVFPPSLSRGTTWTVSPREDAPQVGLNRRRVRLCSRTLTRNLSRISTHQDRESEALEQRQPWDQNRAGNYRLFIKQQQIPSERVLTERGARQRLFRNKAAVWCAERCVMMLQNLVKGDGRDHVVLIDGGIKADRTCPLWLFERVWCLI